MCAVLTDEVFQLNQLTDLDTVLTIHTTVKFELFSFTFVKQTFSVMVNLSLYLKNKICNRLIQEYCGILSNIIIVIFIMYLL